MLLIAAVIGFFVGNSMPKVYEAYTELQIGSPSLTMDPSLPIEARRSLMPSLSSGIDADVGLLRSNRVFREGLSRAANELGRQDLASVEKFIQLFPMFDVEIPPALNNYAQDQTRVVKVKVRAYSGEEAAEIANNVAYAFSDIRRERVRTSVRDTLSALTATMESTKAKLVQVDSEYENLKKNKKVADFVDRNKLATQVLEDLRTTRAKTEVELEATRALIASLTSEVAALPEFTSASSSTQLDSSIESARGLLSSAQAELDETRKIFLDNSPQVALAREKVSNADKRLKAAEAGAKQRGMSSTKSLNPVRQELKAKLANARADIDRLSAQISGLSTKIADKEAEVALLPADEMKAQKLLRDRQALEQNYLKTQEALSNFSASVEGRAVPIISSAVPEQAREPVAPDVRRWVILSALVGGLIGLAYSFAVESFKLPVHTSWQLSELTSLPVVASVPALPRPLQRKHLSLINDGKFKPIEAFRYMAFSTLAKENRPKTMLFTGVGLDVDSAAYAAEFGVAVSRTGSRTILVDCDLRVMGLTKLFNQANHTGVSDVLGRTVLPGESTEVYVATGHENLSLFPAGSNSTSGLLDFNSVHLNALLEQLNDQFDMVIIVTPSVDVYADAARLASMVDEVAMVISAKTTSYRAIPIAQEILNRAGAKNVSIVLSNSNPMEEPFGSRVVDIRPA